MATKESEVLLTELIVTAEDGDNQMQQDGGYTVETINNAIKDGEVEFVKEWLSCLEQSDTSQMVCQIDEKDAQKHTFLGNALQEKQPEIAMLLVCAGADFKTLQRWKVKRLAPVHQAAMKGYKELLKKMIERSPDCVHVKDKHSHTPLHWACSEGHAELASTLISDHGANLDAVNYAGMTPLHVACLEGRSEVAKTLIADHGAKVDAKDQDNATPLHWTCFKGDNGDIVCLLIDHGVKMNIVDKHGHTPLHRACRWGRAEVAKALLDHGAKVDVEDSDGWTPLEVAITEGAIDCAMAVVESDQWVKALRRYNSKLDKTPFRLLILRMPEVAEKVLDRCSTYDEFNSRMHANFWVKFNFEFIEDFQDSITAPKEGVPESKQGAPAGYFSTNWGPKTFSKSNHPLAIMTKKKDSWKILAHPLICCLLHYKWLKFGQLGYFINLINYCLFLIFLTSFTLVVPNPLSATCNQAVIDNATGSPNDTSREENQNTCEGLSTSARGGLYFTAAVIIVIVVCRLVLEGVQIVRVKLNYFISLVNWMELTLYILSIIFVLVFHDKCLCPFRWQWQIGIVAVFLAWINLMIFFSKFPLTGVYVLMFTTICYTFLKILVLSLLLVIAFALTFFLIFHEPSVMPSPFSSPASSLLKITSMTAGDFSFNTIFGLESDGMISFPGISYIMWIVFIIVMPILFTNMLIGLASGDIQEIQKEASLSQLVLLVEQVLAVEELLPRKYHRRWRIGSKAVHPNKVDEQEAVFSKYIDAKLPKKVVSKLRSWVKKLNHLMWGGKDYDTLDSLTRVLNPEEFFTEQKPFESVKQKIKDVNEHVGETQEQRKKEISEVKEALHHLQDKTATGHEETRQELKHSQDALEEMKRQIRDEMKEALNQHQQVMLAEIRTLVERKL